MMLDSLDEGSIIIPDDDEEHRAIDCWTLSMKSGFNAVECDFDIIKIYCEKYEMDLVEMTRLCKSMTSRFNMLKKR